MSTTDAPKMIFYGIKQCQEIAMLAGDPYTQMQIMNTVVHILMQAQVLPSKEFDTWEQTPAKTYPGLKSFIHEAYTRRLQSLALCMTTGQQGYSQGGTNMFNVLVDKDKDEDTDMPDNATMVTQTTAYTTGSTIGNTYGGATPIPSEIHSNQPAVRQSGGYPTTDGGDDICSKLPFPPHAISNSPNPEYGAATFCGSGTGHIQHHSRWWRLPARWTW
jgi:hypothetical protein